MLDSIDFLLQALLEEGRIDEGTARQAMTLAEAERIEPGEALLKLDAIDERGLALCRAWVYEYTFVDLDKFDIDQHNAHLIPARLARSIGAFPLFVCDDIATVALRNPLDLSAIDALNQTLRRQVEPVICDAAKLDALIEQAYTLADLGGGATSSDEENDGSLTTGDEPIVAAVNQILRAAAETNASDVHINPDDRRLHLRYRVDGVLVPQQGPDLAVHSSLVQRLKVMASLDLTQTRRPQDGKFRFTHRDQRIDVRLSILPTVYGENVVMRLLRPASQIGSIDDLLMTPEDSSTFVEMVGKPHGILLVTGPTGSGKTTTLYTALGHLNRPERNIMTIEDPVEIRLPLIRQIQVNHEIGLNFASALRSILRQDPDVVLVGEIRDEETARIAVQSALTGHLVLSTLHTNDAVSSITRLRDLGVPSFAIGNSLLGVVAQRLVRRVCAECGVDERPAPTLLEPLGIHDEGGMFRVGRGCPACGTTGFKGRVGVFEILRVTRALQEVIDSGGTADDLRRVAEREGMSSMLQDGIRKAKLGITGLSELTRLNAAIEPELAMPTPKAA